MDLEQYFGNAKGLGVLATSDENGKVNAAIYARPHVMNDDTVAFIMTKRLTHHNLQSNPHAAYLFREELEGEYEGRRLHLTKLREEKDTDQLKRLRRRTYDDDRDGRFLVFFKVDKVLPLTSAEPQPELARG